MNTEEEVKTDPVAEAEKAMSTNPMPQGEGDMKSEKLLSKYHNLKRRLVYDGIMVGIFSGVLVVGYRYALEALSHWRSTLLPHMSFPYVLLWLLGAVILGYITGRLLRLAPLSGGSGIPQVEGELLGTFHMNPFRVIISKLFGGAFGNFIGLSLGREGPSIQIGAAAAKLLSGFLKKTHTEQKYLITAGSAAGLAAAFSAPISGTIFTLEEVHKTFKPLFLVPALIAAVIADFISKYVFGMHPVFTFHVQAALPLSHYWMILVVGTAVGILGVIFNKTLLFFQDVYKKIPIREYLRPIIAFVVTALIALILPDVLAGGHSLIDAIPHSGHAVSMVALFLIVKLFLTCFCYGSGAPGGIFLPLLVIGGLLGTLIFHGFLDINLISNQYFVNFIILSMAAMMSSVVRSPILAVILVTEMTGSFRHILPLCIASINAYLIAEALRTEPIYDSLLERMMTNVKHAKGPSKHSELHEFSITFDFPYLGKSLQEIPFPTGCLVVSVQRNGYESIPYGDTKPEIGDNLLIMVEENRLPEVKKLFS